ncbi:putative carbonic anhydrase 2 [Iris pallida]|uniref:Carbonic anhydrase 2 n=1 Tax=Iris pallida TaxID=29817 RepID=A0AAX6FD98_IRIPA|nr:putative carbonic anhydrase 2 [Iris pallida]
MESSSHVTACTGGSEGCGSSESGWTMYLASPMHGGGGDGGHEVGNGHEGVEVDEDDDDSMASDASSGPAHCNQQPSDQESNGGGGGGGLMAFLKNIRHGKESGTGSKKNCNSNNSYKVASAAEEKEQEKKKKTRSGNKEHGSAATSFHGSSKGRKMRM